MITRNFFKKKFEEDFISSDFGFNRGSPVDRFYIGEFFSENREILSGVCLEFGDTSYIDKYGMSVSKKMTFNHSENSSMKGEELMGDISKIETLPKDVFDCIVCVNVLNFIYDAPAAFLGLRKLLKFGGYVMLTVAGPSAHISRYDMDRWGDYWRMTDKAAIRLAEGARFNVVKSKTYGNPYSCVAQMNGFCVEDLPEEKLIASHSDYQLVVTLLLSKSEIS